MRLGSHRERLSVCAAAADQVFWYQPPGVNWDMESVAASSPVPAAVCATVEEIIQTVVDKCRDGDHVVVMSNGGFQGIHHRLLLALQTRD